MENVMFGDELPYRKGDNLKHMSLNQKKKTNPMEMLQKELKQAIH